VSQQVWHQVLDALHRVLRHHLTNNLGAGAVLALVVVEGVGGWVQQGRGKGGSGNSQCKQCMQVTSYAGCTQAC
jgi:hypothetical protein